MLHPLTKGLVWLCRSCRSVVLCRRSWPMWILLAFVGTFCAILTYIGPEAMKNEKRLTMAKRSIRLHPRKRVHIAANEVLNFPRDYHVKGVLSLPYGNIVEPFEAWYSAEHKMSRIDYYGGMDRTYQKETMGKHGFACKVVPEYSEQAQNVYRGCLHRRGTKRFPVKAQGIVPASHYFRYVGDVMLRGHKSAKWKHKFKVFNKVNTYILYTTKSKPIKPLRYEMMGYDTLLSSYYDHYVLDYEMFESWHFNYSKLQIPTDLDCFDFSSKKFSHAVGELNPMLEFMPHAENGAPFTLSHAQSGASSSSQEKSAFSEGKQQSYYNPYYNSDDASRETNENFAMENENFAGYPSFLPAEHTTSQANSDFRTNSVNSPVISRNQIFRLHSVKKQESTPETFRRTYKPSQVFSYIPNSEASYGGRTLSRKLEHKSSQKDKQESNKLLNNVHEIVKLRFHKNFRRHFKKARKRSKRRRSSNKKYLRSQRIFNFKKVRRKISKQEKKQKLRDRNDLGWKMSPDVKEMLRRNYEEIVNLLFDSFKMVHKKSYSSNYEHETRKDIYRHNLRFIQSRNRMHLGYKLRSNHLMDMTDEELHKHKGLLQDEDENKSNGGIPFKPLVDHFPLKVDWREAGAVSSVRSQGICGSCYAYAVTGALEGAFFLKNGYLPDFSEQEIIDCSWGFGNRGCRGGYPHRAMQWILKHGGLAKEDNYGKYLAQEGYCHFKNVSIGVRVDTYMNVSKRNATQLKQAIAQYGPVSVLINTQPKSFKFYSSGIYYDPECSGNNLDHAALAVGYGVEKGIPYWLIKNSWSKAWGDSGYIKISQRNNNCGVTTKAVVVRIKD